MQLFTCLVVILVLLDIGAVAAATIPGQSSWSTLILEAEAHYYYLLAIFPSDHIILLLSGKKENASDLSVVLTYLECGRAGALVALIITRFGRR